MCGISGAFASKPFPARIAEEMVARLHHRGPDGSGLFSALDGRLALGHNRLSIVDLSDANAQPFHAHSADVVLVFNGEIYNFKSLRAELESLGHAFHTTGDTEVVVEGYLEWGKNVFARMAGMFALALWDGRSQTLLLARDTFGIKPLYYYADSNRLLFGSEVKAIFADPSVRREFNLPVVIDLASFGFHLTHDTVYKDVRQLPPGHILEAHLESGRVDCSLRRFLSLEDVIQASAGGEGIDAESVREQLAASVEAHLVSDAPLAMSLSGGLDSSAVCALASRINPDILCYTVGYGEESDETPFAKSVSEKLGIRQVVANARVLDLENLFRRMAWHLEEPVPNIQALTPFFLGQALHQSQVKVVLLGEGSDELFGGYPWHALAKAPLPPASIFSIYASRRRTNAATLGLLFDESVAGTGVRERLAFHFNEFQRVWQASRGTRLQRFLHFDCTYQLAYSQLLRVDKMLMAHSVEGRVPFLHTPLLASLWMMRDGQRITGPALRRPVFQGKAILRQAMTGLLPAPVVWRAKFGRGGTQNLYQVGLTPLLQDALTRARRDPAFAPAREALGFINWSAMDAAGGLTPKVQLFLLMLLHLADIGIVRGFETQPALDRPVAEVAV
ncbi:MAG: asparagine synthase (glutamine-hydrolysing) [Anaerolineaceae bacterium]|nr:MAG: asparagine synthase (glutamine-hydrolysing) [Anaerolineaceae bacterium]